MGHWGTSQQLNLATVFRGEHHVPSQVTLTRGSTGRNHKQSHDDPLPGHSGTTQTMELIKRYHKFPNLRNKVNKFIKESRKLSGK